MHAYLISAIDAAGGWIGFDAYMNLALYAPGLGYYSAGARKLGPDGDFVTAPEISPLFGACLAQQCSEVLRALPAPASILEIGAGSGRLAGDLLESLQALDCLPARYRILEVSADLRERQRLYLEKRLPGLIARVDWLDVPPTTPFDGVILANEVLDALPVSRFTWRRDHTEEIGVTHTAGELRLAAREADQGFTAHCARLRAAGGDWDEGYTSEFCPQIEAWTAGVTAALRTGLVLWIDYGLPRAQYYFPQRQGGTLLCHYRQRVGYDPLQRPGLQDITAWVDFSALAAAGQAAGMELAGFTTQTYFLAGNGIDSAMQRLAAGDGARHARLANQARQLMMPGEMGERFKVMAWARGLAVPLRGFALRDFRDSL